MFSGNKAKSIERLIKTASQLSPGQQSRLWCIVAAELPEDYLHTVLAQAQTMLDDQPSPLLRSR